MKRINSWRSTAMLLLLLSFVTFSCKPKAPPPPPPPPPPAPAANNNAPPTPTLPPPAITLRADSVTVTRGNSVTLTWDARNAATVDIQPGIGSVTPVTSGSRTVTPASSVTYLATATGPGGPPANDTLRITVNDPPPPPVTPPPAARGGNVVTPAPVPILTTAQLFERNMQPINFDYDKSDIRDDQRGKLQTAAAFLKATPNLRLTVEGHCDERGSEEYNLALGDRRANAVRQFLAAQGIAENRIETVSYGEERPICSAQTEECFSQNRRAAFRN